MALKGTIPWNKGVKMPPQIVEINSRCHKGLKASEETKHKMSLAHMGNLSNTGNKASDETRAKMREAHKGKTLTPTQREAISLRWANPEYKARLSKSHMGNKSTTGMKMSQEFRDKVSKRMTGRVVKPETRKKLSEITKGRILSEDTKAKLRAIRTDPSRYEEWNRKVIKATLIRPNKLESVLLEIINNICDNQYKYIGNGEVMIGGLNPDFININGQKKVIELYGDRWHQGDNPQDRIDKLAMHGYDCLIIWQSELKNIKRVTSRITKFHAK